MIILLIMRRHVCRFVCMYVFVTCRGVPPMVLEAYTCFIDVYDVGRCVGKYVGMHVCVACMFMCINVCMYTCAYIHLYI